MWKIEASVIFILKRSHTILWGIQVFTRYSLLASFLYLGAFISQPFDFFSELLFLLTQSWIWNPAELRLFAHWPGEHMVGDWLKRDFLQNGADFPKCSDAVPLCSFSPPYPLWTGFIRRKLFHNFAQHILKRLGHLWKQPWSRWV